MRLRPFALITRIASNTIVSLGVCLAICGPAAGGPGAAASDEQRLVDAAAETFQRFLESPGLASWYVAQGKNIKAVFIVSKFVRLAGVAGGKGVLLAQDFAAAGRILRSMA